LLLSLTACEVSLDGIDFSGVDLSNLFNDFPAPEPVAPETSIKVYDMSSSPFADSARFSTAGSDRASMMGSNQMANIAANLASLAANSENITVKLEGHADMRCTESTWQRENGPNPKNGGKWCSPRAANGVTPQGRKISQERAETVRSVLEELLLSYPGAPAKISYVPEGLGEEGSLATAEECRETPNSTNCKHDRRVDVYVSSRTCIANCSSYPYPYPYPGHYPTPDYSYPGHYPTPETSTTSTTTTTMPPPPPPPPPVSVAPVVRAFQNAQQNSDQRIVVKAATLVCAGCQQPPSSTSGVMYGWTATLDSGTVSFTLTPPSGYASPRDYRMTSNPNGKSALSDQTAVMRFYTATRSGAPYRYSATSTVNYTLRLWRLEGTNLTYVRQESSSQSQVAACSPSSCSFGVLGSNVG